MTIRVLGGLVSFPLSDQVLRDDYLVELGDRPVAEIRAMRAECEEAEVGVSFARRILQGHLDIVESELRRRHAGGVADEESERTILVRHARAAGAAALCDQRGGWWYRDAHALQRAASV